MTARKDVPNSQEHSRMELEILRRREAAALAEVATAKAATDFALMRERLAIRRLNTAPNSPQIKAARLAEVEMFSLRIIREGKRFLAD